MEDFNLNTLLAFSPPFAADHDTDKENAPSLRTGSSIAKKKMKKRKKKAAGKRMRIPLQDITHLFVNTGNSDEVLMVGRRDGTSSAPFARTSILLRRDFR